MAVEYIRNVLMSRILICMEKRRRVQPYARKAVRTCSPKGYPRYWRTAVRQDENPIYLADPHGRAGLPVIALSTAMAHSRAPKKTGYHDYCPAC